MAAILDVVKSGFAEALGQADVALNVSFFELGGDSMSAMIAVRAISRDLGRRIPTRVLFQNQSVQELAGALSD